MHTPMSEVGMDKYQAHWDNGILTRCCHAGVDYINDRNKHFNKKIERAFGEYTKVIKENLERGTAL